MPHKHKNNVSGPTSSCVYIKCVLGNVIILLIHSLVMLITSPTLSYTIYIIYLVV